MPAGRALRTQLAAGSNFQKVSLFESDPPFSSESETRLDSVASSLEYVVGTCSARRDSLSGIAIYGLPASFLRQSKRLPPALHVRAQKHLRIERRKQPII